MTGPEKPLAPDQHAGPPREVEAIRAKHPPLFPSKVQRRSAIGPAKAPDRLPPDSPPNALASSDDRAMFEAAQHDEEDSGELPAANASSEIRKSFAEAKADMWRSPDDQYGVPSAQFEVPVGLNLELFRKVMAALEAEAEKRRSAAAGKGEDEGEHEGEDEGERESEGEKPAALGAPFKSDAQYRIKKGKQLLARYLQQAALKVGKDGYDPFKFASWVVSRRQGLSGSWRLNRNGAIAEIERTPHPNREAALALLQEDGRRRGQNPRIGDKRARFVEYDHYGKMRSMLPELSRSAAVPWLGDWIVAGLTTGLTPSEWPLAQLEVRKRPGSPRKIWLHVPQLGAIGLKYNPAYRTLDISTFRKETLAAIIRMVRRSRASALEGRMQTQRSKCVQLFNKVCKTLFPKKEVLYSLHSLRDQFMENMDIVYKDDAARVCTLAGTTVAERPRENYVKRAMGWDRQNIEDVPRALEVQVRPIRELLMLSKEHLEIKRMRE